MSVCYRLPGASNELSASLRVTPTVRHNQGLEAKPLVFREATEGFARSKTLGEWCRETLGVVTSHAYVVSLWPLTITAMSCTRKDI